MAIDIDVNRERQDSFGLDAQISNWLSSLRTSTMQGWSTVTCMPSPQEMVPVA